MTERDDDIAWIEARERGAMTDHPRAAQYVRLGQAIAGLPELSDLAGGDGWRIAVLDQLDQVDQVDQVADELRRARAARVRRRGLVAVLVSTLAVAAIVVLLVRPTSPTPVKPALAFEGGPAAGGPRRSQGAIAIGSPLTARATLAGPGELWIYRGDRLVLRCPGGAGCTDRAVRGGHQLEATMRAEAAVPYTALLVTGTTAAPSGTLQTDADRPGLRASRTIDVH